LFSLNDLLSEVIDVVDNENKHTIHLPDEDLEIYVSKIELQHVFQNLISNTIKHNDKNSTLINISFSIMIIVLELMRSIILKFSEYLVN
jgi:signal transduction histidine kinase